MKKPQIIALLISLEDDVFADVIETAAETRKLMPPKPRIGRPPAKKEPKIDLSSPGIVTDLKS